ncbi:MAG TPA: hypothetical protein VHA30_02790 [Patescibacteria group bacterium]|nr:hypothetical protein [Patescibacteria group bacterium]
MISGSWLVPVTGPADSDDELAVVEAALSMDHKLGLGKPVKSATVNPTTLAVVIVVLMVVVPLPPALKPHHNSPVNPVVEREITRDQDTPPPLTPVTGEAPLNMPILAHNKSPAAGGAANVALVDVANKNAEAAF